MPTVLSTLLTLPPATRTLTLTLVSLSTLYLLLRLSLPTHDLRTILGASGDAATAFPWLVLVPGKVVGRPWTLLTGGFVETNAIEFFFSLLTLPLAGRYLERVWGTQELLKFVAVVVVVSNLIACVVNAVEATVLGDSQLFLYGMPYHGLSALQVGFLVAFTQLIPEHQVQVLGGVVKMRVKSLPMLYVTFSNVACLVGYQSPWILIQFGWLVSWFYLRFVKYSESGDFRGDRSETFAFASWFPPLVQPYVTRLTTLVFGLAVRFRILQPWTDIESGLGSSQNGGAGGGGYQQVPGGQRAEAERRRQLALEALDRRMASTPTPASAPPAPSSSSNINSTVPAPVAAAVPTPGSPNQTRTATVASVEGRVVQQE
ncbi:hypothetical protein JCM8547_004406 [Rhodosporidiobolus lusitaniae]